MISCYFVCLKSKIHTTKYQSHYCWRHSPNSPTPAMSRRHDWHRVSTTRLSPYNAYYHKNKLYLKLYGSRFQFKRNILSVLIVLELIQYVELESEFQLSTTLLLNTYFPLPSVNHLKFEQFLVIPSSTTFIQFKP